MSKLRLATPAPGCSSVTDAPAIYSATFSTGAIDISNALASFSSRGPSTFYTPNLLKPNVSAPGVNVRSTLRTSDSSFGNMSGTSMAGPHVVGVVALLWSARPQLVRDIAATKTILQNTANPGVVVSAQTCGGIPSTQIPNNSFGYGRVDALAAVNSVGTSTPTPTPSATPTPTATITPTPTPPSHAHANSHPHTDTYSSRNAHANSHPYTDTYSSRNAHTNSHPYADTYSSRDAHADSHPHTDTYSSRNAHPNSHPYADIHADSYGPANSHTYAFNSRYYTNTNNTTVNTNTDSTKPDTDSDTDPRRRRP